MKSNKNNDAFKVTKTAAIIGLIFFLLLGYFWYSFPIGDIPTWLFILGEIIIIFMIICELYALIKGKLPFGGWHASG